MSKFKALMETLNLRKQIREFTHTYVAKIEEAAQTANPAQRAERLLAVKDEINQPQEKITRHSMAYILAGVALNICLLPALLVFHPLAVVAMAYTVMGFCGNVFTYGAVTSYNRRRKLEDKCLSEIDTLQKDHLCSVPLMHNGSLLETFNMSTPRKAEIEQNYRALKSKVAPAASA